MQDACVRGRNDARLGPRAGLSRHGSLSKPRCEFGQCACSFETRGPTRAASAVQRDAPSTRAHQHDREAGTAGATLALGRTGEEALAQRPTRTSRPKNYTAN